MYQDSVGLKSTINSGTYRAELIVEASLIIWEELLAANVAAIDCVDDLCKKLKKNGKPFGGIPFLGIGDFRQVAPVVRGQGPSALLLASIKSSPLCRSFRIFTLYNPHRSAEDPEYTTMVDDVGEDYHHPTVSLDMLHRITNTDDAEEFLFPPDVLSDSLASIRRTLLSPINLFVDDFNAKMLDKIQEDVGKSLTTMSQ